MKILTDSAIILYGIASLLVILYNISQFSLFFAYLKRKEPVNNKKFDKLPFVTIQLPIFNEKYVIERLFDCIEKIDYPYLEIQILDDSTDECKEISRQLVEKLKEKGINVTLIQRKIRTNFKAGALKNGLETAKGEFIAIFDADFLPNPDWISKTIHFFTEKEVGVVQTRWQHINRNYSFLTKIQGLVLDHHFSVEQAGRNQSQNFINFNGTAGIWRKSCIIDAGNWEGDTLTEDLDLSYRAQLKGWQFVYLEDVGTPSELPVVMSAVRSQQFRWNKGGAENFRKFGSKVIKSKMMPFNHKIQSLSHLFNSSVFLWVFVMSILSVPLVLKDTSQFDFMLVFGSILKYLFIFLFVVFYFTFRKRQGKSFLNFFQFLFQFILFFPVILGLSFHNSVAVLEGYFGKKSEFVRTPKFNILSKKDGWKGNQYLNQKYTIGNLIEILLILYFVLGIYLAFKVQNYSFLPFHILLVLGYSIIIFKTLDE